MLTFSAYLEEATGKTGVMFDMDETLVSHDHDKLKVHVNDENGRRIASLTNQQYNSHKLKPGHTYDYSEFKSASTFKKSSKPIGKMIAKMRAIRKNTPHVHIVTARTDMDDKHAFGHHMAAHGIDINQVHVHRAGNIKAPTDVAKKQIISGLIKKHGYKHVHLYDDHPGNLETFKSLKADHPDVTFHAHHVDHDPKTGNVKITTTRV